MKRNSCNTINIAHRGARSLAPENTLAAARQALESGADMWELDVSMSADGVLYLIHDDTLERTSNVAQVFPDRRPWQAHTFTFDEIRRLDFGSWFIAEDPFDQIATGNVSEADLESYRGEPAPTLQEALAFTRDHDWRANVEIKDLSGAPGDADIVEKVVTLIEDVGMVNQVLISSFNHNYIKRVKAANPKIVTGALVYRPLVQEPVAVLREVGAEAFHPKNGLLQPEAITALQEQGFAVNVYTVNDEASMRTLVAVKASGIITDFPQLLKPILEACR